MSDGADGGAIRAVVKVQRPITDRRGPWLVYDQARQHVALVLGDELPLAVRNGMALADKAYFHALWTDGRWVFGERTRDRAW
jgi:hypothetical protein